MNSALDKPAPIALLGSGLLHAALARSLGTACRLTTADDLAEQDGNGYGALAVCSDADDRRDYPAVQRYAERHATPWLPVRVESGWILIGPAVTPPNPGCPTCVARRRGVNRADGKARAILRREYADDLAVTPSTLVTPLLAAVVSALVVDELSWLRRDSTDAHTSGALLCVHLRTGAVTRHGVLPDPLCPACATLLDDSPDAAVIPPRTLPKADSSVLRLAELDSRQTELERLYVDAETGVVASLGHGLDSGVPTAVARLTPNVGTDDSRHGYGRTGDFRSATLTALTEALERMAGTHPRGRRTAVRAAYAEVAERAIDPRTLGLYPDDWYDQPDFGFTRFDPERETWWVWGYSFARAEPVLMPRSYAYYGSAGSEDPGTVYESSNGCALGGCLEEAILHGLLEVAERDAFLMTWYTRRAAPRVDLHSARDRRIPVLAERIGYRHGYEVLAFDITLEQRVPAFWVMVVDQVGGPDRPRAFCGAAAHPDPERALRSALYELAPGIFGLRQRYRQASAARMLAEPDLVREMHDHALLNGHPDAFERLGFLPMAGPARPLSDLAGRENWPRFGDLGQDLAELVGRYLATGLDVIAVDTTSAEQRVGGFACAKVIVPGTLSMTFGHRYRRVHGLPRLTQRLAGGAVNPFPHPFP